MPWMEYGLHCQDERERMTRWSPTIAFGRPQASYLMPLSVPGKSSTVSLTVR